MLLVPFQAMDRILGRDLLGDCSPLGTCGRMVHPPKLPMNGNMPRLGLEAAAPTLTPQKVH
mgnify:CR=1 FL=1